MAGSTPIYGFPYPQSSDLVANYPALGEDLAEDIETVIAGLGTYQSFTPTVGFGGWVLGNATVTTKYTQIGKFVHWLGSITFGSTSTFGTGNSLFLTIPVSAQSTTILTATGNCTPFDNGVASYLGESLLSGGGFLYFNLQNVSATYAFTGAITNTTPFTWGNTDSIRWSIVYEAA